MSATTIAEATSAAATSLGAQAPCTLMNRPPRGILDLYSKEEVRRLYEHLHNDNPTFRYVFGLRGKKGESAYKHADKFRRLPVSKSIEWAIRTVEGIADPAKRHTYVPLPNNPDGRSRWAGVDIDHHAGELERATDLALRFFLQVVNEPFFVVLETSGVGFKLWLISQEFHPVSWWIEYLNAVCARVGVKPQPGVLELFPDREAKDYGRGLRAFGSWNPRNDRCNGILFDDLSPLVSSLPVPIEYYHTYHIGELKPLISRGTGLDELLEMFAIRQPATRHDRLLQLVNRAHVRFCRGIAREAAQRQFEAKTVQTAADLAQHLREFDQMWDGRAAAWCASLSASEAAMFNKLGTDAERDAFRIIRDFSRASKHKGFDEFPISRDSIASRIRMTPEGAGKLRRRFCEAGIIEPVRTRPYIPHKQCAIYRWTAN